MLRELGVALRLLLVFTLLTGGLYPVLVTAVARTLFAHEAQGSLIERDGKVVGSALIAQAFSAPQYFWTRPSATTPPYNGATSSGSNQGPLNPALTDAVKARVSALHEADATSTAAVPVDLVTASGSGLDPHISPAAAAYQVSRVARARGIPEDAVRTLVAAFTEPRTLWILGEPRVNVLLLNLALDQAP